MRRALACAGLLLVAAAAGRAHAGPDLRLLTGGDVFLASDSPETPISGPRGRDVEAGLTLIGELRNIKDRFDLKLDYRGRFSIADGNTTRNFLNEVSFTARRLGAAGRIDLTVGRFRTPGGFWLIADGGRLVIRANDWLSVQGYGGLRSFTTGRVEATLAGDVLPLAGAAIRIDHSIIKGSLAFTWARDRIDLSRGEGANDTQKFTENEFFLLGDVLILPHPKLLLAGSASVATRYDLGFSTASASGYAVETVSGPTAGVLSSFAAHALVEYRPVSRLRLAYLFDFTRARIVQSKLLNGGQAAGGSFEDHALRASLRLWRSARVETRYRIRFRENTDVIHRVEGSLLGDDLVVGLGAFFTFGVDYYSTYHVKNVNPSRIVYQGGVSYVHAFGPAREFSVDARVGVLYLDALSGCTQAFSFHVPSVAATFPTATTCYQTTELYPFVLEAQRVGFARAFVTWRGLYAGFDGEMNLTGTARTDGSRVNAFDQVRVLAQAGYAL